jgi:hypothetical protein
MTNNKQQTAINWLESKFIELESTIGVHGKIYELIEQAKEMEKEQIVEAVNKGWNYHEDGFVSWMGEQYYNETYGGNK